jgi:cyclophilin family peptidyl-prolyl cis-trans isomerase
MIRIAAVLAAAALLVAAPPQGRAAQGQPDNPLGALPAAAKEPLFLLTAKPEKEKVALGEKIRIDLTLHSRAAKIASCGKLELGSPSGVAFYVRLDKGATHQVCRLMGRSTGREFKATGTGREELKPGKSLTGKIELLAVAPGGWEITASYGGVDKGVWPDVVEAKPFTVTVGPGPGGETKVGARIRTGKGVMVAELFPDRAFNTVHNFLTLASNGFYDGLFIFRIVRDFMVQTGDPKGNGTGGPGYYVPGEVNGMKFEKGILSLALESGGKDTGGSQFFVVTGKASHLESGFTAFGKVVEGMAVLDALNAVETTAAPGAGPKAEVSLPVEKPKLERVEMVLLK